MRGFSYAFAFFAVVIPLLVVLYGAGFYPIALVHYAPITESTWESAQKAAQRFAIAQAKSESKNIGYGSTIDAESALQIKKDTLTFLIEDRILSASGSKLVPNFEQLSEEKVLKALAANPNIRAAAEALYGLSFADFQRLVLLPQARRDVAGGALAKFNLNFDEWLADEKKNADVRLIFVPFKWDGKEVQ